MSIWQKNLNCISGWNKLYDIKDIMVVFEVKKEKVVLIVLGLKRTIHQYKFVFNSSSHPSDKTRFELKFTGKKE